MVLISHSCDICHNIPEQEPFFEILPARHIEDSQRDGNLTRGKSPRRLQLGIAAPTIASYELKINECRLISRTFLESNEPTAWAVASEDMAMLRRWLRRRYDRTELPTAFNIRCKAALIVLERLLKSRGREITRVLVKVHPHVEIEPSEQYTVDILLTVSPTYFENPRSQQELVDLRANLLSAFGQLRDVEILDIDIESEANVTLDQIAEFTRWDYSDYLSAPGDPAQINE
ncbi:MAG: hypothetical protein WA324_26320 [Bryobacteraceae bacterium]